jgi:hypothetical protein
MLMFLIFAKCRFYQHILSSFFVRKSKKQLLCAKDEVLFFGRKDFSAKVTRKMLVKLTTTLLFFSIFKSEKLAASILTQQLLQEGFSLPY